MDDNGKATKLVHLRSRDGVDGVIISKRSLDDEAVAEIAFRRQRANTGEFVDDNDGVSDVVVFPSASAPSASDHGASNLVGGLDVTGMEPVEKEAPEREDLAQTTLQQLKSSERGIENHDPCEGETVASKLVGNIKEENWMMEESPIYLQRDEEKIKYCPEPMTPVTARIEEREPILRVQEETVVPYDAFCIETRPDDYGASEIKLNASIEESEPILSKEVVPVQMEGQILVVCRVVEDQIRFEKAQSVPLAVEGNGKRKYRKSSPWWGPSGGDNSPDFVSIDGLTDPSEIKQVLDEAINNKIYAIKRASTTKTYFTDDREAVREALSYIRGVCHAWKRTLNVELRKCLKTAAAESLMRYDCLSTLCMCLVDMPDLATKNGFGEMVGGQWEIYNLVWTICVNYTDISQSFAVEFCVNPKLMDLLKQQLLSNYQAHCEESISERNQRVTSACSLLCFNIAQVETNRHTLKMMGFVEVLSAYLKSPWDDFRARALLTMAFILDEQQNAEYLADPSQIQFLLSLLEDSVISPSRRCEGWSTEELLRGVARLAINDANKRTLIEEGVLPMLVTLLNSSDIEEKRGATKTMYLLTFDKKSQTTITKEPKAIETLMQLCHHKDPAVVQNARGAIWVLGYMYKKIPGLPVRHLSVDGEKEAKHVMISYQWKDQDTMKKIKACLVARGYKVWMDIEKMHGSTLQTMAEAVENAAVVLICFSQKYKDSPNCRAEAEYAFKLGKDIVPLKLENGYRPDGWLGILIGTKLYFDFTRQLEEKFEELVRELCGRGRLNLERHAQEDWVVPSHMDYTEGVPFDVSPVSSMDDRKKIAGSPQKVLHTFRVAAPPNLQQWFDTHSIYSRAWWYCEAEVAGQEPTDEQKPSTKLRENMRCMSGEEIVFLRQLHIQAPEFFYRYLEKRLQIVELRAVMKIVKALETLNVTES